MTLSILVVVAFFAGSMGAITGGNSLIMVPTMLLCGIDAKTAIATNMVGVVCLSGGAALRFLREGLVPRRPTLGLVVGALPGAVLGAAIAVAVRDSTLKAIVGGALLGMALFLLANPELGSARRETTSVRRTAGYLFAAVWAVYGGLFSGGYTTILTVAAVPFFGVTLVESVALTKVVNLANSLVAVCYFAAKGRIDWRLALLVGLSMSMGGWVGAHLAILKGSVWVRRVMVVVVFGLGLAIALRELLSR